VLQHCERSVPYYAQLLRGSGPQQDPGEWLQHLPILTKDDIRANFANLQSTDLDRRKWFVNTSGGSTGEPVRLIQDAEYADRSAALALFYNGLLGCEVGQPVVRLWGSERDLEEGTRSRKTRFFNWLTNATWLNAFQMSPKRMREFIETLNRLRPRLIAAYAQAIYELAQFAERERVEVKPQSAIFTSAGTLYPFMREKIAHVFGCPVYNLYGSREVSDIAWELPGSTGLWVSPWSNFLEIVDEAGQPVPAGTEGNIIVTCLTNYAMPLLRYRIGDRGALMAVGERASRPMTAGLQVLKHVSGRSVDVFRTRDNTLIDGEYFTHLLYYRSWVSKFQVVQKSHAHIIFKLVKANGDPAKKELEEIAAGTRRVMGSDCRIDFDFLQELPAHPSGKHRYTISEVSP
jgi:phenylacetate-CoA ligase